MNLSDTDIPILNSLVGPVSPDTAATIAKDIDCFLHAQVSLFVPSYGQCVYAVTPGHTHPAYSFIYYFQSFCDLMIEETKVTYDLADGKCLCAISPQISHQEIIQEHFQSYIAIQIDAELFRKTMVQYVPLIPVFRGEVFVPHPELLGILRCFMLEAGKEKDRNSELLNHLAPVIVHLVVRSVLSDTQPTVPLYDRFEVDRAVAYMNSHLSEKITIDDLARQVNRSTGHFAKIFKSVTGSTPMDFLNQMRIQKARNMLLTNEKNITEIAMECGFNSSSYFSACFLEKYKMTPSAFRQKFQPKS